MTLVVDASVALKWFVEEPGSTPARRLLAGQEPLIAPDLLIAEVFNAAWRLLRRGELAATQHDVIVARLADIFAELVPLLPIASAAASIGRILDHPIYDCLYIALAERTGTRMVTADRRLLARVADTRWQPLIENLKPLPP